MENWERTRGGKENGGRGVGGPAQSLCVYGNSTVNHTDLYNYRVLITILTKMLYYHALRLLNNNKETVNSFILTNFARKVG